MVGRGEDTKIVSMSIKDKKSSHRVLLRSNHIRHNSTKRHCKGQQAGGGDKLLFPMKFLVDRVEFAVGDVGVNLGGRNTAVTKQELNGPQIGAVTEQVGGKTVAQGVWCDLFNDSGLAGVERHQTLDTPRG